MLHCPFLLLTQKEEVPEQFFCFLGAHRFLQKQVFDRINLISKRKYVIWHSQKTTMPTTDQTISFLSGDGRLDISRLFKHYSKPLFYYALKFVDEEAAKDIVQDIFFKLWEDKTIQVNSSLNGLLFTMVRNKCLQLIEKQKVRENFIKNAGLWFREEEILFYSSGNTSIIELELQEQLGKAISSLPEKCRQVFILSRYQNKMNKEIAEELDINIKTVEKHISNALRFIRSELKDYLPLFLTFQCYLLQNHRS